MNANVAPLVMCVGVISLFMIGFALKQRVLTPETIAFGLVRRPAAGHGGRIVNRTQAGLSGVDIR
jgi:hypothetical protein